MKRPQTWLYSDCSVLPPSYLHWTPVNYKTGLINPNPISQHWSWTCWFLLKIVVNCSKPDQGLLSKCLCTDIGAVLWHGWSQSKWWVQAEPSLPLPAWQRAPAEESGSYWAQGLVAILGLGPGALQRRLAAQTRRRMQTCLPRGQTPASTSEKAWIRVLWGGHHRWICHSQLHKLGGFGGNNRE